MKTTPNKKARHLGNPGMSSRAIYRNQKAKFLNLPLWKKIVFISLFSLAGFVVAFLIEENLFNGLLIGTVAGLIVAILFLVPDIFIIAPIVVFFTGITYPIVYSYLLAPSQGTIQPTNEQMGWNLFFMLTAVLASTWISVQYSKGKAWVTLLLTLSSTFTVGYLLLTFFPSLGIYNAFISMALMLFLRCGFLSWVQGLFIIGLSKTVNPNMKINSSEEQRILGNWVKQAENEKKIASILDGLNNTYTIFHDMTLTRKETPVQHLIIGPTGVFILSSVNSTGYITENKAQGVQIPGTDINTVAATLLKQRKTLSKKLKTKEENIQILLTVIPSNTKYEEKNLRKTLAVFKPTDGAIPSDYLTIISEDQILKEIDNGFALINKVNQTMITQRAKIVLRPSGIPTPAKISVDTKVKTAIVDADGKVERPEKDLETVEEDNVSEKETKKQKLDEYSWAVDGASVSIQTTAGVIDNLKIVGKPYKDKNKRLVAEVCVYEEWFDAQVSSRKPKTYTYPVSAMMVINT